MNQNGLLALYTYNAYANSRLLDTAALLSEEEFSRESSPSLGSVRILLLHMFAVEATYLRRCQERPFELKPTDLVTFADIQHHWSKLAQEQQEFIRSLDDGQLERTISFSLREHTFQLPWWQLLTQAFVHSTHHRGELSIVLSGLGHPLPTLDIIAQFVEASGQRWPWA